MMAKRQLSPDSTHWLMFFDDDERQIILKAARRVPMGKADPKQQVIAKLTSMLNMIYDNGVWVDAIDEDTR